MVGDAIFNVEINNRLKDIKGSSLPFRRVSIIAIGDLFQLQPVTDGFVFKDTRRCCNQKPDLTIDSYMSKVLNLRGHPSNLLVRSLLLAETEEYKFLENSSH